MALRAAVAAVLLLALASCADSAGEGARQAAREPQPPPPEASALPAPNAPIPRTPQALAERLTDTQRRLDAAIDEWRASGELTRNPPPEEVTLLALHQQRIHLKLTARRRLAAATLELLPGSVAAHLRATFTARRKLGPLVTAQPLRAFRTGPAAPSGVLLGHYREAQRRFGVRWPLLAAVNFVETAFGRMRNNSVAEAQGPMQFIQPTWEAYGMGGNVRERRDAILGAANYLHANGAPRDERNALFHYNPSSLYVDAVLAYAGRIRRDPRAFFAYYSWQVFVRTPSGVRRITGPGL